MFIILLILGIVLAVVGYFQNRALMVAGLILVALSVVVLLIANLDDEDLNVDNDKSIVLLR